LPVAHGGDEHDLIAYGGAVDQKEGVIGSTAAAAKSALHSVLVAACR
jgi:hypothetical protein